jgi:hypothetical protein
LCETTGKPLYWASSCVRVSLNIRGAESQGIDYDAAEASLQRAIAAWMDADCDGERPSIDLQLGPPVTCDQSEYNREAANANIVLFHEDEWPHKNAIDPLGLTRLRFDPDTGEIWDADIELNAADEPLSIGEPVTGADLDSIITHEIGHLLGLGHTLVEGATMEAGYEAGTNGPASLHPDDIAGICALYPPSRKAATSSCEPRHGFSELCGAEQPEPVTPIDGGGCSVAAPAGSTPDGAPVALGLLGALLSASILARSARRARAQHR